MKVVINSCYGGFSLSNKAYAELIKLGVPLKEYVQQKRDLVTGRYLPEPANDGEVIFQSTTDFSILGRYWDNWTRDNRTHPLLIQVIEQLGTEKASGDCAKLKIVEIPDDVDFEIDEYDGIESIHEKHRSWF